MISTRRIRLAVRLGATVILGVLVGGTTLLLQHTRATALHAADVTLQNAALVVANTINRQLLQVDGALTSLPALFAAVADQKRDIDPQIATRLLRSLNFETFVFRDLLLVRSDGTLWAAARPRPRNQQLLSTAQEASATTRRPGAVTVEGPTYNSSTGEWSWLLVRPVSLPAVGQLQAVAEVPLSLLTGMLAPTAEIPGIRIFIERPDGLLLASLPHDELKVGKQHEPVINRLGPLGAVFRLPSWTAATPSIAVWRNTLYPDVQVALTLDLSAPMADWVTDRDRVLVALALAGLLVIALASSLNAVLRQRERVEAVQKKFSELLDSAIESMSDGFVMWDEQDRLLTCNQRFRDIYSVSAAAIRPGAKFEDIIREGVRRGQYPQAGTDIDGFVRDAIKWHRGSQCSFEDLLPNDRWVLVTERANPTGGIVGIRTEITVLKRALSDLAEANDRAKQAVAETQLQNTALLERDQELRLRNMLFTAALNNMSQGLLMVDKDRRVIVYNERFLDMFRIPALQASSGMTTAKLFNLIEMNAGLSATAVERIVREQERLATSQRPEVFVTVDGDRFALAISQRSLPDGGWIATYEDVTEQQRAQGRIRFMAHHDALTQLPNRVLFQTRLNDALDHLTDGGDRLALLYLDLDRFKFVNDTLGHPAGDALLEAVARRLQGCVRKTDFVARLGGDEFAILYSARNLPSAAITQAQRVVDVLSAPYEIDKRRIEVGVSIGIAIATDGGMHGDTLLKNADMALYQAKAKGERSYCVFEADMEARMHERLTSEADLRAALECDQFEIYYQPIFDLQSEALCGFEALLRWNHPTRGLVMPGQFIPLAEELGFIKPIGAWALHRTCADASQFLGNVKVAVNLSPIQFEDDDILETVGAALRASGLHPSRLELEITESTLLNNSAETIAILVRLHRLGLTIALDDFGTGYSSLSYLRSFPFDTIKIDRLFISEMATREDCAAIVRTIVDLAGKLGMTTTAEGVETKEQFDLVRSLGCTAVQGYLLGRPEPLSAAVLRLDGPLESAVDESTAVERTGQSLAAGQPQCGPTPQ